MEKIRSGILVGALLAANSLSAAEDHTTGTGIVLKPVNPEGATLTIDGSELAIPGGAPFSMAKTEVTQTQFKSVLGHNPSETEAAHLPVDRVTVAEATAFCEALTKNDREAGVLPEGKVYRLPTLREWLLAGLPGGQLPAPEALEATAWHKDNTTGLMHPVGAKTANAYGLHDMIGNAAEWVTPDKALNDAVGGKQVDQFESTAVVQVPRMIPLRNGAVAAPGPAREAHLQSQFQVIQARATIDMAVETLGLDKRLMPG